MSSKEERADRLLGVPYLTGGTGSHKKVGLRTVFAMLAAGFIALAVAWTLTRTVIAAVGILPDPIVFVSTFSPVLSAAVIGGVVRSAGGARGADVGWLPMAISGLLAVVLAVSDPWVIVALGMGGHAPIALRLFLLFLPVVIGASFAHPAIAERGFLVKLAALGALLLAIYIAIYWFVLPSENLIAIQRPLRR